MHTESLLGALPPAAASTAREGPASPRLPPATPTGPGLDPSWAPEQRSPLVPQLARVQWGLQLPHLGVAGRYTEVYVEPRMVPARGGAPTPLWYSLLSPPCRVGVQGELAGSQGSWCARPPWSCRAAAGSDESVPRRPPAQRARAQHSGLRHKAAVLFALQEGPEAEIFGGERSVFYLLMKMFVTSTHLQLKSSTKRLIIKVRARPTSHSHCPGCGAQPTAVESRMS